jgi:hypothetical protein
MIIKIYKEKFPQVLLPGWYWRMRTKNSVYVSGPYLTMLQALKDVIEEMRFQVRILNEKSNG